MALCKEEKRGQEIRRGEVMLTCREAEKMVMPYIDEELGEDDLDEFLEHIWSCDSCKEELEIYYTASSA